MTTVEKKSVQKCDCPNTKHGRDVIVITIETCCKRPCDGSVTDDKSRPKSDEEQGPKFTSTPARQPSRATTAVSEEKFMNESGAETEPEQVSKLEPEREPEPQKQTKPEPETDSSEPTLQDKTKPEKGHQKVYKLPLVLERHHGPGCAMEISVLEKHEASCMYKKEESDGRNIEDRVGSYECIGRMVFRTCNPTDLESDSSGPTTSASLSPTKKGKPAPSADTQPQPLSPSPSAPDQVSAMSSHPHKEQSTMSTPSVYNSAKSEHSHYDTARSRTTFYDVNEETAVEEKQEPVEASRSKKHLHRNEHHVLMATSRTFPGSHMFPASWKKNEKSPFIGDDCQLQPPKNPILVPGGQFDKIYSSKKTFRIYTDEGNQTDFHSGDEGNKNSKISLIETISSLTDLSKSAEKKKSSFLSSLFRKSSTKSSSLSDSKKIKK